MAKKIGLIIGVLILLLIVLLAVLPTLVSADRIKAELIARVKTATGRDLTIAGPFSVRFFPFVGIHAEQVTLSNPPGFANTLPLLQLNAMNVDIGLLALLHREVLVKDLSLAEPRINLQVNAQGIKNWDFALPAAHPAESPAASPRQKSPASTTLQNLTLGDVTLKNGTLTYASQADKNQWDIEHINAKIALKDMVSPFDLSGDAEWNHKTITFKTSIATLQSLLANRPTQIDASIGSDDLTINAQGNLDAGKVFTGKASIASSSAKQLLAWLMPQEKPLPTPAPLALQLTTDIHYAPGTINLSNAHLIVDKLDAQGTIRAVTGGAAPLLDLAIVTNQLDFNPFLPPAQPPVAANSPFIASAYAEPADARWSSQPIDFSLLKRVNLHANIQAGSIIFRKITIGKTALQASVQNGKLSINLPGTQLYGGTGDMFIAIDGSATPPAMESRIKLAGIQAAPFLQDAAAVTRFSGTANMAFNVISHGDSEKAFIDALAGTGNVALSHGAVQGIDLNKLVSNQQAALQATNNGTDKTEFTNMGGSFAIAQGIASNNDLSIVTTVLTVSGQGQINLPAWSLAYRLTPQLSTLAKGKEGLTVPILVEGSINQPHYRADVKSAVQDALKDPAKFKEQLHNSKDAVKSLKGLLQGFKN